jgi:hypothetical protein
MFLGSGVSTLLHYFQDTSRNDFPWRHLKQSCKNL